MGCDASSANDQGGSTPKKGGQSNNGRFQSGEIYSELSFDFHGLLAEDAEKFGVSNGDIVGVKVEGTGRSIVFGDTVVRVSPKFSLAMHIDTDESNAGCCFGTVYGEIIK